MMKMWGEGAVYEGRSLLDRGMESAGEARGVLHEARVSVPE